MHGEQRDIGPGRVADGADEGPVGANMASYAGEVEHVAALGRVDGRPLPCFNAARAYSTAAALQDSVFRQNRRKSPIAFTVKSETRHSPVCLGNCKEVEKCRASR